VKKRKHSSSMSPSMRVIAPRWSQACERVLLCDHLTHLVYCAARDCLQSGDRVIGQLGMRQRRCAGTQGKRARVCLMLLCAMLGNFMLSNFGERESVQSSG